ncbi:MAG: UrcA family protein [Steroidobacteraceae bacterium]|jgi:UrcA family protein
MKIATSSALPSMIATALLAITCLASTGTALAWDYSGEALTKKVTYGDLNLDNEQGAKALYNRIRSAAKEVCAPFESKELARRIVWQTCVDHAVTSAVGQVNRPMVTAVHNRSVNRSSAG